MLLLSRDSTELLQEFVGIKPDRIRQIEHLDYIEAPLATLEIGDEGLMPPKRLSNLGLI